jgi:hypothetical protein
MELLLELRREVAFEIELFLRRSYEVVMVLRKGGAVATDTQTINVMPFELWPG